MAYTLGIDISKYQTAIDWNAFYGGGYRFAFVRATQGSLTSRPEGLDPAFRGHVNALLASHAPVRLGFYHAYLPAVDGVTQARFFWNTVKEYMPINAFPLAVDVEITNDRTPRMITDRLYILCRTLIELSGQMPMIYTSPGFWNGHTVDDLDDFFSRLPLWAAHWTTRAKPLLPRGWSSWRVWQYTNNGLVNGYKHRIDKDRVVE